MLNTNSKHKKIKKRSIGGSLIAENAGVLYVLFVLIFFPLVDLAAMGLRTFCLWYACNQGAMAGAKGTQWTAGAVATGVSSGSSYYTSIQTQAISAVNNAAAIFSGISVNAGYPQLSVILTGIAHSDTVNNQTSVATVIIPSGNLPLGSAAAQKSSLPLVVDNSQYVPILRVTVVGTIQPFIKVPFFINVPGLSSSFQVTIQADQQIEDPLSLST